jgi:glycosyltransferase involved in cell wall biosynthesis
MMNQLPLITVVIPLYNGAQYIRRSVRSVLQQSYADFELIVVDDGSEDCGGDVVLEFTDPRLCLVQQAT